MYYHCKELTVVQIQTNMMVSTAKHITIHHERLASLKLISHISYTISVNLVGHSSNLPKPS
jgi:hypothetical protein